MDEPMKFFLTRRLKSISTTLFLGVLITAVISAWNTALIPTSHLTGWSLFTLVLFLAFYNARKKLTYPPLLKASTWMQMHIYVGFLALLVFLLHNDFSFPTGKFETFLYLIFMLIVVSGMFGLFLSRTIPKRLTERGQEVIFERIPMFIAKLEAQAQVLVVEAVSSEDSNILEAFYRQKMRHFMCAPQNFWRHFLLAGSSHSKLEQFLRSQYRYLNQKEIDIAEKLVDIIKQKHDLDFHYSLQKILKLWLFVHIPLTFSLLVLLIVHLTLVFSF